MSELFVCPNCNKNGKIGIRARFSNNQSGKVLFYAKCSECGYESTEYDKSSEVIDLLYGISITNKGELK